MTRSEFTTVGVHTANLAIQVTMLIMTAASGVLSPLWAVFYIAAAIFSAVVLTNLFPED